jgi:hypothetical protein
MKRDEELSGNEVSEDSDVFITGRLFCDSCGRPFAAGDRMLRVDAILEEMRASYQAMHEHRSAPLDKLSPLACEALRVYVQQEIAYLVRLLRDLDRHAPPLEVSERKQ